MGLSLWHLFKAGLLGTNSLMILNRPRFLAKYGLHDYHGAGNASPVKAQLVGLLHAVSFLKYAVIVANILVIIMEILIGG